MLIKFSPFSANVVCLFCIKTINANNKTQRCNNARFLSNTLKKTDPSLGKSLISTYYSIFCVCRRGKRGRVGVGVGCLLSLSGKRRAVGWGWVLIQGWALLTFSAFTMGTYLRWALIRINTASRLCSNGARSPEATNI